MNIPVRIAWSLVCILLAGSAVASAEQATGPTENPGEAGDPTSTVEKSPTSASLAQLAAAADVVAVVQMRDGDYRYQREFPISGSAYLKVLIPYKVDQPLDLVEVYETGLHENECYFPNPTVFEEGRRYLVFLRRDPDDEERYRGLPQGCALDVLVTGNNTYALRLPVTGIDLSDALMEHATAMEFADPYARESDETLDSESRDAWLEAGLLRREMGADGEELVYTQGIMLGEIRSLLGPDGLTMDRHQKRIPSDP
jgi:hypothetical protein